MGAERIGRKNTEVSKKPEKGCSFKLYTTLAGFAIIYAMGYRGLTEITSLQGEVNLPKTKEKISGVFAPGVRHWSTQIRKWAKEYDLPPNLVATVMQIESCGNPLAQSPDGAAGLFQVMPYHFEGNEDPLNPQINARRGLNYLRWIWDLSDRNLAATFAGYNGGPKAIEWILENITEEGYINFLISKDWKQENAEAKSKQVQRFIRWGTGILNDIENGLNPSPTLNEWYNAGGVSLCGDAEDVLGLTPTPTPIP